MYPGNQLSFYQREDLLPGASFSSDVLKYLKKGAKYASPHIVHALQKAVSYGGDTIRQLLSQEIEPFLNRSIDRTGEYLDRFSSSGLRTASGPGPRGGRFSRRFSRSRSRSRSKSSNRSNSGGSMRKRSSSKRKNSYKKRNKGSGSKSRRKRSSSAKRKNRKRSSSGGKMSQKQLISQLKKKALFTM